MGRKTMEQIYMKGINAEQYGEVFFIERVHSYRTHALIRVNQPFNCIKWNGCSKPINPGDFAAIVFFFQKYDGMIYCRDCINKDMKHWQKVLRDNPPVKKD